MRKPLDRTAVTMMVALCMLWGLQQVAIKATAPSLNPVLQVGIRSTVGAILLLIYAGMTRQAIWRRDGTFWPGVLAGAAFALEFLFIAVGLFYTTASHMVVFLYTMPIFAALGLHWLVPGERLLPVQWLGVLTAFLGIVCAFSSSFFSAEQDFSSILIGDMFGIGAGLLWAATTLIIRSTVLSEAAPTKTLLYQLVVTAVFVTPRAYLVFWSDGLRVSAL